MEVLPNGVKNGYTSIYQYDGGANDQSIGRFYPEDTLTEYDPHGLNVPEGQNSRKEKKVPHIPEE